MRPFRFVPIAPNHPFENQPLEPRTATSKPGFPCRICLRDAEVGERLVLRTYTPFTKPSPYRATGPVFLHEVPCEPFIDRGELPEISRARLLSVRAFDEREELVTAEIADGGPKLLEVATAMFHDANVHHLDVHIARPGCFAFRMERA